MGWQCRYCRKLRIHGATTDEAVDDATKLDTTHAAAADAYSIFSMYRTCYWWQPLFTVICNLIAQSELFRSFVDVGIDMRMSWGIGEGRFDNRFQKRFSKKVFKKDYQDGSQQFQGQLQSLLLLLLRWFQSNKAIVTAAVLAFVPSFALKKWGWRKAVRSRISCG